MNFVFGRLVALVPTATLLLSGCTQLVNNHVAARIIFPSQMAPDRPHQTTNLTLRRKEHSLARAEIIKQFGPPVATWTFQPPLSLRQADARHIVTADSNFYGLERLDASARIGRIDEFRIHGPVANGEAYAWDDALLKATWGLADLLLFPSAVLQDVLDQGKVTQIRVFYRPDETFLHESCALNVTEPQ